MPTEQCECARCGDQFCRETGKRGRKQIHCSKTCADRAYFDRQSAAKQDARRAALRPCPTCGRFPELSEGGPIPVYCSPRCSNVARGAVLAEPHPDRVCPLEECGVTFTPRYKHQRCCSERHGKLLCSREGRKAGKYRDPWSDRRRDNYHRRRALKRQTETGGPVFREEIADRDGWICGLCGEPVSPDVAWPDPLSPSVDHIVPLSKGGGHTVENVQLTHLQCNVRKGDRV